MDRDTDRDCQEFGQSDPYWAVLTDERYKSERLTPESMADFFRSGEEYVAWLFDQIRHHVDPGFEPSAALDFGCGVGRLALPLAGRCRSVVGVDVAPGMLEKARAHAEQAGADNITFVLGDDEISAVAGPLDFVNSFIVLQHIPADRGERLFRRLVDLLRVGGVGALHLTYSKAHHGHEWMHRPPFGVRGTFAAFRRELAHRLRHGRSGPGPAPSRGEAPPGGPVMQMNDYAINRVFHFLQEAGVRRMAVIFTDHGGEYGTLLLFRKDPGEGYRV